MAQRELRYGDIIHLSTYTGVVGSFYAFPFLNQLLVLGTEGPGIQQSQALWCNFIVLPPYALVNEIYFVAPGPGRHDTLTGTHYPENQGQGKQDQGRQVQRRQHRGRQDIGR